MSEKLYPVSFSITLSDDLPHPITVNDIFVDSANLTCLTNPLYYGDGTVVDNPLLVGDTLPIGNINLRNIFIRNYTGGSNGVLKVTGLARVLDG
jgi:hypothetical protein